MSFKDFWKRGLSAPAPGGGEVCDPRPMEIPDGSMRPVTLEDEMRMLMRNDEFRRHLENKGVETFEDADDFELPDEDMSSPWEENFDPQFGMTRELELMAGAVVPPDFEKAKLLVEKARAVLARYDEKGNLKSIVNATSAAPGGGVGAAGSSGDGHKVTT